MKRGKEAKNINDRDDLNVIVVLGDGQTWTDLGGCSLLVLAGDDYPDVMDANPQPLELNEQFQEEDLQGVYALDELVRGLPLSVLRQYRVSPKRPPKPKGVKRQ